MHPKLEEIRKRLQLIPPNVSAPPRYITLKRDGEIFSPGRSEQPHVVESEGTVSVPRETPESLDGLGQAVAALFEPARQCQGRLAEITEASESMRHLTRVALELCEPLKSFHDHIRKLSSSFESMRTFRDELSVLAESFAPVRALHAQVIQLAETVRTHLTEVSNGLEPAKALQGDIADLARAIDSISELQAQFYALSKGFGDATDSKVASTEATEDSLAWATGVTGG
jgi:DNA repair ATPase RecN